MNFFKPHIRNVWWEKLAGSDEMRDAKEMRLFARRAKTHDEQKRSF